MPGTFADRLLCRRITLAIALGLLAILFAVEAKTAWYAPFGAGGDVQSAKAFPADTPKVVAHRVQLRSPLHSQDLFFPVFALVAVFTFLAHIPSQNPALRRPSFFMNAAFLSPLLLFRPPPAL